MKVLFDKGTPRPLRSYLRPHRVTTAAQLQWDRLENGALLRAAVQAGFEAVVTTDSNWRYQQDLMQFPTLIMLVLRETDWRVIRPQAHRVKDALDQMQPGEYRELRF
jgi:hypothetical protein